MSCLNNSFPRRSWKTIQELRPLLHLKSGTQRRRLGEALLCDPWSKHPLIEERALSTSGLMRCRLLTLSFTTAGEPIGCSRRGGLTAALDLVRLDHVRHHCSIINPLQVEWFLCCMQFPSFARILEALDGPPDLIKAFTISESKFIAS